MKILIISDSHGKQKLLTEIVSTVSADHVIHCGDFCTEKQALPKASLTVVQGNCDFENAPEEEIWEREGYRFFITHGHKYQVKIRMLNLKYRAEEVRANIVCFGHSHIPLCKKVDNTLYINPGSIYKPRDFPYPTYACLETAADQVKVTFTKWMGRR